MDSRNWIIVAVAAALVAVPILVYQAGVQDHPVAPDFTLTSTGYENGTLGEPVEFSLSDYRNKTVLLDFMAIACTSCRFIERDVLEPLHHEFGHDTRFVILSIDTWADPAAGGFGGETNENLVRFQQERNHTWRHALDDDQVFRKYDAIALPKLAVIGPEGQIVAEWTGQPSHATVRVAVVQSMEGDAPSTSAFRFDNVLSGPWLYLGVALVAGVASFFAPCSVGLMPAYLAVLLKGSEGQASPARRTMGAGLATAVGIVSIYVAIAAVLWALAAAGAGSAVAQHIDKVRPVMAIALVVLGLMLFWQVGWDWLADRLGRGAVDGRRGFFAFGTGYGLAAFGCTGPIFLPTLVLAFAHSSLVGLGALAVYSLAVAGFVLLAAALVAGGHQTRLRAILSQTALVTRVSAVLLVVAGVWLLWFDWQAGVIG